MITEFDIKPIPKNILNKIKKLDLQEYPKPNGNTRFYKYFTQYRKELCEVVVAVRNPYKNWYCKQVVVHGINTDKVYLQDIGLTMGFYKVGCIVKAYLNIHIGLTTIGGITMQNILE